MQTENQKVRTYWNIFFVKTTTNSMRIYFTSDDFPKVIGSGSIKYMTGSLSNNLANTSGIKLETLYEDHF